MQSTFLSSLFFVSNNYEHVELTVPAQIITATGTRFLVYADLRCLNCHQVRIAAASVVRFAPVFAALSCIVYRVRIATSVVTNMSLGIFSIRQGNK